MLDHLDERDSNHFPERDRPAVRESKLFQPRGELKKPVDEEWIGI